MKFIKNLFIALLILTISIIFIVWLFAKSVKPETIKAYINTQLSTLTHKSSKVEGDISWQIVPRPGIKITHLRIGNEINHENYFVKLDSLLFNLKITPLLRGKLVFNELNVDGFEVTINPDATPSLNPPSQPQSKENFSIKAEETDQFAIEQILLTHGKITILKNQKIVTLSGLQIGAKQFNLQHALFPLQFKTNLAVITDNEKIVKAHANFTGNVSLSSSLFKDPVFILQNTPLEGQLSLRDIKLNQLKLAQVSAHIKTKPGVLFLNPLTLNLYNGESVGDLKYEFASAKLIINQTATNLDSSRLISDLLTIPLIKGKMDFSLHMQANLQQTNWQDNLAGNGNLTIKDGFINFINLNKIIQETSDKINKLLTTPHSDVAQVLKLAPFSNPDYFIGSTPFKLLTFQYHLQDGILQSNSLVLQTDKLQLKGVGSLNLKDNNIDSHLSVQVTLTDPEVEKIQQLLGGSFPIVVKGNLTKPLVLPDLQQINPILTKAWLQETLTKPVKQIQDTIKTIFD
ncbi:AsmA family protein [Legionella fairfieldensis]|uniref:AsmA family protein n=1 Tax=Legionella fairfieldensis TaxID=45064 RepID=UPI00048A6305|nr:AsmA family protein [Legionella fairfieldensis]